MKAKVYTSVEDFKKENELLKADLPFCEQTDILKDEVKIGNLTLKNRLVCQAMEAVTERPTGVRTFLPKGVMNVLQRAARDLYGLRPPPFALRAEPIPANFI